MPRYTGRPLGTETFLVVQRSWLDCCASFHTHRFDCTAEPERHRRSGGPFLPVRTGP